MRSTNPLTKERQMSPSQSPNDLRLLADPFQVDEYEWRVGSCGKTKEGKVWATCLCYVQARAIMDRLDDMVGPQNWKVSYDLVPGGVMCHLSIKVDGEWITKMDGAENSDIEPFKGGISGALKRAAVPWGIGRLLYNLDSGFAQIVDRGVRGAKRGVTQDKTEFYWLPPTLPDWAIRKETKKTETVRPEKKEESDAGNFASAPTYLPSNISNPVAAQSGTANLPGEHIIRCGTPGGPIRDKKVKDIEEADKVALSLSNMIKQFKAQGKEVSDDFKQALEMIEAHYGLKG